MIPKRENLNEVIRFVMRVEAPDFNKNGPPVRRYNEKIDNFLTGMGKRRIVLVDRGNFSQVVYNFCILNPRQLVVISGGKPPFGNTHTSVVVKDHEILLGEKPLPSKHGNYWLEVFCGY